MADEKDIVKIIAGVVGAGIVGAGIVALIQGINDDSTSYTPDYEDENEDDVYEAAFYDDEEDIHFDADSTENNEQNDEEWVYQESDNYTHKEIHNDIETAQEEFNRRSSRNSTEYLYIDFTQHLKTGSRNWNDVYREPLETQFDKVHRKLVLHGKTDLSDLKRLIQFCFPSIRSAYYVSLPSFNREIEKNKQGFDCIYNMVIRPEKSGLVASFLPNELDLVLIGDLVFRNNIITFVVKGLDLIDENVKKFGELKIECAAACAISKNDRNLPDFGLDGRDLYKSFLTRDKVLSLCENVYPIEQPEKAISVFEEWKKYLKFRNYFLDVQSQRNESICNVTYLNAYSISRTEYRKNEELYEDHLLDGNKNFIQRNFVLLNQYTEDAAEFPLIKVEIIRNLAEINKFMARNNKISRYEIDLRRFSRTQVTLSQHNPCIKQNTNYGNLLYLGNRIAFEVVDIVPDCDDILEFFEEKLKKSDCYIEEKYKGIIRASVKELKEKEENRLEEEVKVLLEEYSESLDRSYQSDIENNTDRQISKRYSERITEIQRKYRKKKKQLDKKKQKLEESDEVSEEVLMQVLNDIEKISIKENDDINNIPLDKWYLERNQKLKRNFEESLRQEKENDLDTLCNEKENLLKVRLAPSMEEEKKSQKNVIENEKNAELKKKKEKLTKRHFYIYFKAENFDSSSISEYMLSENKYLVYDNRAEKKKIERQEKALYSFYHGYVKNPFLASYLFVPETLRKSENNDHEMEWFGNRLNDSQKEAVRRGLSSNSIFLLQGPPGTGKTEVIAELTAQYVKQGKKVLVSSETHKAIDNVFERLPKIPEIRPLRLIPSMSNKKTEYSPEKLVDNLYLSISNRLNNRIEQYENFTGMKNNFSENLSELRFRHSQVLKLENECRSIKIDLENLNRELIKLNQDIERKRISNGPLVEEKEQYEILISYLNRGVFDEEIEKSDILFRIGNSFYELFSKFDIFNDVDSEKVKQVFLMDIENLRGELNTIESNSSSMSIEQEKASLRSKMRALRDPDTDDVIEDKKLEYDELRKQLISLKNADNSNNEVEYSSLSIAKLISADQLSTSTSRSNALQILTEIKEEMINIVSLEEDQVRGIISEYTKKIMEIDKEISELKIKKNEKLQKIDQLNSNNSYDEFRRKQRELRAAVVDFFEDFEINDEYPADDFAAAIEIINTRWNEIEKNQELLEKENKTKIPLYKAIRTYLGDEEILEGDRVSYTKKLFDNANVFGMTCTSREFYSESSMESLREYKLGDINIRNVGIDVVIIDEVSKSSFLDLLIPVLYGKTVILVGDHRQLPPLYDLKHMRNGDFEGLDPEIIDYDLNQHYQEMYETCFFKELYEKVNDSYKIMLDKQYRCHSDIMDVFNHFYSANGKGLTIGLSNQNDLKQHNLLIKSKGITLIEPENHIYFVNSTEFESSLDTESSSKINRQEAEVVCTLLNLFNEQYGHMINSGELLKDGRKDNRKSIGVICTYRDQARHIKNKIKGIKFPNVSTKREERLIINTVDDFQGDERDIIIVSMVRNPRGSRYSTDFIDQFERINVALSRARCMLVIVGSQEFLSRSSINLPDINGRKELDRNSFPVYKEIIRTVQSKGKVLQATDIIGEVDRNGK